MTWPAGSSWWFNPYSVVAAAVRFPQIVRRLTWLGLPFAPWKNLYQTYVTPMGSPSTGWIGAALPWQLQHAAVLHMHLLMCTPEARPVRWPLAHGIRRGSCVEQHCLERFAHVLILTAVRLQA